MRDDHVRRALDQTIDYADHLSPSLAGAETPLQENPGAWPASDRRERSQCLRSANSDLARGIVRRQLAVLKSKQKAFQSRANPFRGSMPLRSSESPRSP